MIGITEIERNYFDWQRSSCLGRPQRKIFPLIVYLPILFREKWGTRAANVENTSCANIFRGSPGSVSRQTSLPMIQATDAVRASNVAKKTMSLLGGNDLLSGSSAGSSTFTV